MLKAFFMALALLAPTAALADDFESRYCSEYDGRPEWCSRVAGCEYDYRWDACRQQQGGGGGGGTRACSAYDFDPAQCNSDRNCQYNYHARSCDTRWQPNPGDQCSYWNRDPRGCDAQPNCAWDRNTVSCQSRWQDPNPGRRPVTTTVRCESGDYRYNRCAVYGQVVSAYITRQFSSSRCVQNRSWGFDRDAVWVSEGCRAEFQVTYYPRF